MLMNNIGSSPLLIRPQEAIDTPHFERLRRVIGFSSEIYNQLSPEPQYVKAQMADFYETGKNPDLSAKHLDMETLDGQESGLRNFKYEILEDVSLHPLVQEAYRWRVNELLANVRMAKASAAGDTRRFDHYNYFVYGGPSTEITAAVVDWFRQDALDATDGSDGVVAQAGEDMLDILPDLGGDKNSLIPSQITFERVRADHYREGGYLAVALAGIDLRGRDKITPEVGEPALEKAIHNIGAVGYTRDKRTDTKAWAVSNANQVLTGPSEYNMPINRFIGLPIGHELRHVIEYVNGLRSALKLNAIGLDRYEWGNEGRAVIPEQIVYGSFEKFAKILRWQDILRRHFSIAYALGITGEAQAFSEVFAAVNAVDRLWERRKTADVETADAKARQRTESLLFRSLKGTDGTGGAYRKDMVYLEGNVRHWQLAQRDEKIISEGDKGKFDLANPRHIRIERALGVLR